MAMVKTDYKKLLEPGLRKVFFEAYAELPEQFSQVFNVHTSKKAKETDYRIAGLGVWPEFDGNVEYEDYEPGDEVTYVHKTYAKGLAIPLELAEDDLYGIMGTGGFGGKRAAQLGRGARIVAEQTAADIFNNAFTDVGYDGKPLAAYDHPLIGGGTGDNYLQEALSVEGLKKARLKMRKLTDEKGVKIQATGDTLVVPPELEYTAIEILQSDKEAYTGDNTMNVFKGRINKLVVLDYLEDPKNWFLLDSGLHELNFFWRVRPEFKNDEDIDRFTIRFVGRERFSVGYSDWRGVVGSEVS